MGGNGSAAKGLTNSEAGRKFKTVGTIGDIQIVESKNPKQSAKLPEESHTPNRIYAEFRKDGKDVGAIAVYGPDCKKIYEIHTADHHGLNPHVHYWKDGKPVSVGPLDASQQALLDKVRKNKK